MTVLVWDEGGRSKGAYLSMEERAVKEAAEKGIVKESVDWD